jgi:hypothetical protein
MYRILKPKGRLVIVDSFRTQKFLNPMMNKIYNRFQIEYGNANLEVITDIEQYFKEKGFVDLKIEDISKNVRRSIIQWSIIALPYYVNKKIMGIELFKGKKNKDELKEYYRGNTILAGICGLYGIIKYFGISALKQ